MIKIILENMIRSILSCFRVKMIEIEHLLWLTAAILNSENLFLFYDVIETVIK